MAAVGSVDVELELIALAQARFSSAVVRDETDNNLLSELPTYQIQVIGGTDDGFRLDRPLVDIDTFAATRAEAIAAAGAFHGWLMSELRGSATENAVFGAVQTVTRPAPRPYENNALRRVGGTYAIHVHPV